MIHQFRDKKQIAQKRRLIKNFIFLILFLLLGALGIYSYTSGFFHFIGKPIWKARNSISQKIEDVGYVVRTKTSVYKENENLILENKDLKNAMVDYQILKNENISLKESLGRIIPNKNLILSSILTKPNYSPYDTIIIDIGLDSNVAVGNQVYSNDLIPIGEVSEVYSNTSLVTLYTNPGEVTEAMIDGTNTSIELVGRGGGNFEMTIPLDLPFTKGTLVYLPNIQTEIVAVIEDVISTPNDPVKKVLLSSPVNVQSLKWVLVKRD
jgi:cell shape-determining protein MreC